MNQDELSEFLITKEIKKLHSEQELENKEPEETLKREPLTAKNAVKFLLDGTLRKKICRYCLNIASSLYELDQVFQIGSRDIIYKVTVRDMIASFHPFKVADDPNFPSRICDKCLNRTFSSYLFTQQCEQSERALRNCFDDIYDKLNKLDPIERTKKRGRQKLNPNYNILYTEHEKVIDYADPIINIVNIGSSVNNTSNEYIELQCPRCWQVLPNIESLLNHEKLHPKSMWYNCHICGKSFVKQNHLKKHVRNIHASGKELVLPNSGFKCTNCGISSDSYHQHLQHIEKHKFQTVMKHLVERNMDKLCAICLNKGTRLIELDKTVSLHGGHPELTGDRTIYSILGSTLPERKSYKYQELLVANKAKIVTLVKKLTLHNYAVAEQEREMKTMNKIFPLSHPIIISILSSVVRDNTLYLFSKPQLSEEENIEIELNYQNNGIIPSVESPCSSNILNVIENSICETEKSNINKEENLIAQSSKLKKNKHISFSKLYHLNDTDDKPISVADGNANENNRNSKIIAVQEPCKFCWLFINTKKCEYCKKSNIINSIERNNDLDQNKMAYANYNALTIQVNPNLNSCVDAVKDDKNIYNAESVKDSCKFCWLFKNVEKCEYCKKSNDMNIDCTEKDSDSHLIEIKGNNHVVTNQAKQPIKRKIDNDINVELMISKWKCNVCLTDNTNRQTCFCCDSQNYNCNQYIKVNLKANESCFSVPSNINQNIIENSVTPAINTNAEVTFNSITQETYISTIKTDNDYTEMETCENIDYFIVTASNESEYINKPKDIHHNQEEMDVVIEELSDQSTSAICNIQNFNRIPSTISYPSTPSFQFQIGTGSSKNEGKPRRFMKPLRRMANMCYK
ncbi:uncharacterized protein LOC113523229 isoform X1 [Galleria mellonella]|uniref:Uncharacterized protein LOC113523229 isoform X1 n=1 Tax=Galleria mellonella TaxID=7137 RepID=A0A6J3BTC6_GALME|nr:uncharacterized protein LOC113523229 isoform X1 [Galleria mellonella]